MPVDKKIWSQMQDFIGEGHNVLSPNYSYHLEKITTDKYAFLTDLTRAHEYVAENSDFTFSPEIFHELFSIALQLNSAYTDDVTKL